MNGMNASPEKASHTEKIGFLEKFAYGSGDLASNLILVLSSTFVAFFYTDALGLNAGIVGAIVMVSRMLDGFTDMLMGYVVDRTRSKYGKTRPWILWLAVPIAVSLVLMFCVPNFGEVGKYVYITITYNLVTTVLYTAINIPYGAMTALMSRDQDQRMVINIFRMFMAQMGGLLINATTLPLVNAMGGSAHQRSWIIVALIYGVLAAVLFLFCFAKTKERVNVVAEDADKKLGLGVSLKLMIKNSQWLILALIWLVMALGLGMSMSVGTYYAKYVLGDENVVGYLSAIGIVPVLVLMPFLPPVIRKIGKRNLALIGVLVNLVGQALFLVSPVSAGWLMFCSVIKGVGMAALHGTLFAMIADTIEYGQWKNGKRVEGILYSSTTFGAKVGVGVAAAIALSVIGAAGYDGLAAVQTPAALEAIKIIYLYVPIAFAVIPPILFLLYKLDKIYPQVMEDLQARETEQAGK